MSTDAWEESESTQYPLSLIFSSDGSMRTNPNEYLYYCSAHQEFQFKQNFKVIPSKFIHQLQQLEKRCIEHGVIFKAPNLTDSVDQTVVKIRAMNRAIKTAKQKKSRENMSEKKRADANNQNT